jgi:hypothetical protein
MFFEGMVKKGVRESQGPSGQSDCVEYSRS